MPRVNVRYSTSIFRLAVHSLERADPTVPANTAMIHVRLKISEKIFAAHAAKHAGLSIVYDINQPNNKLMMEGVERGREVIPNRVP